MFVTLVLAVGLAGCGGDVAQQLAQEKTAGARWLSLPVRYMPDLPHVREEAVEIEEYEEVVEDEEPIDEPEAVEEVVEELSPEEVQELLNSVPYAGMTLGSLDWFEQPFVTTETSRELGSFIFSMNDVLMQPPQSSFTSPDEADPYFLFHRAYAHTNRVQWGSPDLTDEGFFYPELYVIAPLMDISFISVTLHSHMEQTARQLFGMDLELSPQALPRIPFASFNLYGVYVYGRDGFGPLPVRIPIIFSYEYIGGGYEVVCAFVLQGLFDDYSPESMREWITKDELLTYLQTTTNIHTITLKNNPNGGFYYWAHILPPDYT